jgi:undecaprenyl-diphosphatase
MVLIGTIPAVVIGASVKLLSLDHMLENIFVVAAMLMVTSALMFCIDRISNGKRTEADAPFRCALLVGSIQAVAILPGLSRSGSTIFGGVLSGFNKEFAVKYSFILSIPAILGAGVMELSGALRIGEFNVDPINWAIGFVSATLCGIIAIRLIKVLIKSKKFYIFGIYCFLVSIFAFVVGIR